MVFATQFLRGVTAVTFSSTAFGLGIYPDRAITVTPSVNTGIGSLSGQTGSPANTQDFDVSTWWGLQWLSLGGYTSPREVIYFDLGSTRNVLIYYYGYVNTTLGPVYLSCGTSGYRENVVPINVNGTTAMVLAVATARYISITDYHNASSTPPSLTHYLARTGVPNPANPSLFNWAINDFMVFDLGQNSTFALPLRPGKSFRVVAFPGLLSGGGSGYAQASM